MNSAWLKRNRKQEVTVSPEHLLDSFAANVCSSRAPCFQRKQRTCIRLKQPRRLQLKVMLVY